MCDLSSLSLTDILHSSNDWAGASAATVNSNYDNIAAQHPDSIITLNHETIGEHKSPFHFTNSFLHHYRADCVHVFLALEETRSDVAQAYDSHARYSDPSVCR